MSQAPSQPQPLTAAELAGDFQCIQDVFQHARFSFTVKRAGSHGQFVCIECRSLLADDLTDLFDAGFVLIAVQAASRTRVRFIFDSGERD